jgi:hypothetical protein
LRTVLNMNEPGPRSRALGNVFKGGGGVSRGLIERLGEGRGPDLAGVKLVRGHFPLGIRELLPRYLPKERELCCFTFLREPADRTLSHFFAVRAAGRGYGLPPLAPDATLEDALAGGYLHDNLQTRMLSGQPEPFGEVDEAMLEQAKHNLAHGLVVFGLTERFDESLVLAKKRLGLRSILYRTSGRVNTARPRGDKVPAKLRKAAERCNPYDTELYRYAEQLFDQAPERDTLDFQIELAALQAAKTDTDPHTPPPTNHTPETWQLLLQARTQIHHLEHELAASGVKAAAARLRTDMIKQRLATLEPLPAKVEELEQELARLEGAGAKAEELEQQIQRLEAAARARPKRSARQGGTRSTRARPKRDARRDGANPARAKRNARHESSKRAEAPGAKARRRGDAGKRTSRRQAGPGTASGSEDG